MNNPGQASLTGLPIVYYHAVSNRPHAASHALPGCARDERHEKVPILMHLHESSFAVSTPRLLRGLTAAALSVLALSISVVAQALQVTGLQEAPGHLEAGDLKGLSDDGYRQSEHAQCGGRQTAQEPRRRNCEGGFMEMHQDRDFLVPLVPGAARKRVGGRMGSVTDRMVIDDRKTCQGSLTRIIHERFCCNRGKNGAEVS